MLSSINIYYSPDFSGFVYTDFSSEESGLGFEVAGTAKLLQRLCKVLGVSVPQIDEGERLAAFIRHLSSYISSHPGCPFADVFALDPIATARQLLEWNDKLQAARWRIDVDYPSPRLKALAEIISLSPITSHLSPEETALRAVVQALKSHSVSLANIHLKVQAELRTLPPNIQELLDLLKERGAEVEETLPKEPQPTCRLSLLTCHSKADALRHLAQSRAPYDLWIVDDNQTLDALLARSSQPTTGSTAHGCLPAASQTLVVGLNLFQTPFSINNLLAWLRLPYCPLGSLARRLANLITQTGGYHNDDCRRTVEAYCNGTEPFDLRDDDTDPDAWKKRLRRRRERVSQFLPPFRSDSAAEWTLPQFVENIANYASQRLHSSSSDEYVQAQLYRLVEQATQTARLLPLLTGIPTNALIRMLVREINQPTDMPQHAPQAHCRTLIDAPQKIAARSLKRAIWLLDSDSASRPLTYDFLSPSELDELHSQGARPWLPASELAYRYNAQALPLRLTTEQLTILLPLTENNATLPKHPLITRIEKSDKTFDVQEITFPDDCFEDTPLFDNSPAADAQFVEFNNAELLPRPLRERESASSLTTMIQRPFDYVLNYLARISERGESKLDEIERTKGNVAHAVIEQMLTQDGAKFDTIFEKAKNECGAILLLEENILQSKLFKRQLRDSIEALRDIIDQNNLHVENFEEHHEADLHLAEGVTCHGYIDLLLKDAQGNPVVFDLKWTHSPKYHEAEIAQNRALQLAVYAELLKTEQSGSQPIVAYFVMPGNQLYSTHPFKGRHAICKTETGNNAGKDLLTEIRNSYNYRRQQFENGKIELGEPGVEQTDYQRDTLDKELFPFEKQKTKKTNKNEKYAIY